MKLNVPAVSMATIASTFVDATIIRRAMLKQGNVYATKAGPVKIARSHAQKVSMDWDARKSARRLYMATKHAIM